MKRIFLILIVLLGIGINSMAQVDMRIALKDGTESKFKSSKIKNITFEYVEPLQIEGEWFNYDESDGAYEVWNLQEEGLLLYTYCLYGMSPAVDDTRGLYRYDNDILTLNAISSILKMRISYSSDDEMIATINEKNIRCYRLTKESVVVAGQPVSIGEPADEIFYADNNIVSIDNGKIKGWREGEGYALVRNKDTQKVTAYKIHVSPCPEIVDVAQTIKMSKYEILEKFGNPTKELADNCWVYYLAFPVGLETQFFFDNKDMVRSVILRFASLDEMRPYIESIKNKYIIDKDKSNNVQEQYYDAVSQELAKLSVLIEYKENEIGWYVQND